MAEEQKEVSNLRKEEQGTNFPSTYSTLSA